MSEGCRKEAQRLRILADRGGVKGGRLSARSNRRPLECRDAVRPERQSALGVSLGLESESGGVNAARQGCAAERCAIGRCGSDVCIPPQGCRVRRKRGGNVANCCRLKSTRGGKSPIAVEKLPDATERSPKADDDVPVAVERQPTAAALTPVVRVSEPSAVPLVAAAVTSAFLPTAVAFVESAEATSPSAVEKLPDATARSPKADAPSPLAVARLPHAAAVAPPEGIPCAGLATKPAASVAQTAPWADAGLRPANVAQARLDALSRATRKDGTARRIE